MYQAIDVCKHLCVHKHTCIQTFICEPKIYVYIICLLFDKFMPLLFVYHLNSFSTGYKYLLQRNSLPVAIKWGVYHVQMISGSTVITKGVFLTFPEIWCKSCWLHEKKLLKRGHRSFIFIKSYPISYNIVTVVTAVVWFYSVAYIHSYNVLSTK